MKNTLLALMLVSSLFVISCGADSTKPQDAYKSQPTETVTGTRTKAFTATTGTVDLTTSYYSIEVGEKVTEIVQVTTTTGTGTKTTNTVTGTTKNADGGIYQFTINDATFNGTARVTYKYIMREAAPMVEKEATVTYSTSGLIMNTDFRNAFDKSIVSVTDKNGKQLISGTDYEYHGGDTITIIPTTTYVNGDPFTVRYSSRDITKITEKPLTGNVTPTTGTPNLNATIQLDAATYAGRSYYIKANVTDSSLSRTETIYDDGIVLSTGTITITAPNNTLLTKIDSGTYELWVY